MTGPRASKVIKQDPQSEFGTSERFAGSLPVGQHTFSMGRFLGEAIALVLMSVLVPFLIYLDATVLFGQISETSLTEWTQALLIFSTAALFFVGARKIPTARGYLMSAATLCFCMFLRENDAHFDDIWHGFWAVPVGLVFCFGFAFAVRHKETLRAPFLRHAATREGAYILVGFVVLLIFSRIYGSGDLWRPVMAENYSWEFKAALQEGIELMGYSLLTFGTVLSYRSGFGQGPETAEHH